jgi:hypothetical protein
VQTAPHLQVTYVSGECESAIVFKHAWLCPKTRFYSHNLQTLALHLEKWHVRKALTQTHAGLSDMPSEQVDVSALLTLLRTVLNGVRHK